MTTLSYRVGRYINGGGGERARALIVQATPTLYQGISVSLPTRLGRHRILYGATLLQSWAPVVSRRWALPSDTAR